MMLKTNQTKTLQIWSTFHDGSALTTPTLLNQFYCVCFADLKKYKYSYWFCYPAFVTSTANIVSRATLGESFSTEQKEKIRSLGTLGEIPFDLT